MVSAFALAVFILVTLFLAYYIWMHRWKPYDPSWLVTLAQAQHPDKPWLVAAIGLCTRAQVESPYYTRFIALHRRSRPGSSWHFDYSLPLVSDEHGELALDIFKGGRVGGVQFVSREKAA